MILYDNDKKLFEGHYEIDCSGTVNHCDLSRTHRTESKNILKKAFVSVECQIDTGKELPWGNLTGITTCKNSRHCLYEEGIRRRSRSERYMKETYLISDEKLDLGNVILQKENMRIL